MSELDFTPKAPRAQATLRRYMSFAKFVDLLDMSALYLTWAHQFEDLREGRLPPKSKAPVHWLAIHCPPRAGQCAHADGKRLRVSETSALADALMSIDQYAFGQDAERKNRLRVRLTERLAHDA